MAAPRAAIVLKSTQHIHIKNRLYDYVHVTYNSVEFSLEVLPGAYAAPSCLYARINKRLGAFLCGKM